jgi:L-cystine transport system permease protein
MKMVSTYSIDFLIRTFFICLKAIPVTLYITGLTLLFSMPAAFIFALIRMHGKNLASRLIGVYITVFRGIPIIIQILLLYDMFPPLFADFLKAAGISYNIYDLNPIVYALIIFSISTTAVLSEVFRSALLTVEKSQFEAAYTVGLTRFQAYRRIIIPQALASAIPNICTATINLIKTTSLAFVMTVKEITAVAKVEAGVGYNYFEAYTDIWIIYIIVCITVEQLFKLLEKKITFYRTTGQGVK